MTRMDDLVLATPHENGVVEVILNRPDKMNALTVPLIESLVATAERVGRERTTRAIVLRGAGRAFCAGIDVTRFAELESDSQGTPGRLTRRTHGTSNLFQRAATVWADLPIPVIAAVHGVAFGGGLQIALGADIRLVAPGTKLSVMEIKWGIVPDMAGMVLMRRLVRPDAARELALTGRIVEAAEAAGLGLATRVVDDPAAEALRLAGEIAGKNPHAVRAAKRLFELATHANDAAVLVAESVEQDRLIGSPAQREAMAANLEKRAPVFADPEDL